MDDATSAAYEQASGYFVGLVEHVGGSEWTSPGLGEWNVLELVAHTNRAHTLVESYLVHPQPAAGPEYFAESAIAQRARDAVDALGDAPVATVRRDAERALAVIAASPADAVIGSPMGSMALSAYLPSRSAELVIHGLDLARALTLPVAPPADAIIAALEWVGAVASRRKVAVDLLLAATGRAALPPGFSVY